MKISSLILLSLYVFITKAQSNKEWSSLAESEYSIKYPKEWELDRSGQMNTSFIIFAKLSSPQDQFRENVNLLIQDLSGLNLDLDKYVKISEEEIKSLLSNNTIIESKRINIKGKTFHKEIYSGDQGIFKLKFEQYYFIREEKAYILTFTSEINQFDSYKKIAEQILESFKLL